MAKTVNKHQAENCPTNISSLGRIYPEKGGICPVHPETFFSTLILKLRGTKLDEAYTQGSPQYKEQVLKEVFLKSKNFPSDFG
jgi:hypothetical protein